MNEKIITNTDTTQLPSAALSAAYSAALTHITSLNLDPRRWTLDALRHVAGLSYPSEALAAQAAAAISAFEQKAAEALLQGDLRALRGTIGELGNVCHQLAGGHSQK